MIGIKITRSKEAKAHFFVQRVGDKAGMPLRKESANCFKVVINTALYDPAYVFYTIQLLWEQINKRKRGCVQQFITANDIEEEFKYHMKNRVKWS